MAPDTPRHVAAILNAAWMVRHYARGGRLEIQRQEREQAIRVLAITLRDALQQTEDFEPLLAAVVDGLRPKNETPF